MLETLHIRNFVLIENSEIQFKAGLNILSGETGAGKSIIIDAISLLLGERAQIDSIRTGAEEASVEGLFDIQALPVVQARLVSMGVSEPGSKPEELLIRRTINRSGKHRVFINGTLATLSSLQAITEGLIDLCSQHEHQVLLKPSHQLDLLDRYAGLLSLVDSFRHEFVQYQSLKKTLLDLTLSEAERSRRVDFLKFQVNELREADLEIDEDTKLHEEKQLLQNGETRLNSAQAALGLLENEDSGVVFQVKMICQKLRHLLPQDPQVSAFLDLAEKVELETNELADNLHRYTDAVDLDPNRLAAVQDRLALIASLRRKYGATVTEMRHFLAKIELDLANEESVGTKQSDLSLEVSKAEGGLLETASSLSAKRQQSAVGLSKLVTRELQDLKMEGAEFQVHLESQTESSRLSHSGLDHIQFMIRTNAGDEAKPIGKIASGGELSRVMLSIRRVISDKGGIGVYLFDEIDTGMGGQTAFEVGRKLKSVAKANQVICITHLPQVAAFADHHLTVKKQSLGRKTATEVASLNNQGRKEELARMLGGSALTKKSLENAAELLQLAK